MKDYVAAAVLGLAPVVLIFVPWYEARARDGTTAAGHIFLFGLLLVGLGALCILLLGSSLHRVHRARLGRKPTRADVSPWAWSSISCIPRPTPDHHHSSDVFDRHAGGRAGDAG